jgi:hypothetical protein
MTHSRGGTIIFVFYFCGHFVSYLGAFCLLFVGELHKPAKPGLSRLVLGRCPSIVVGEIF